MLGCACRREHLKRRSTARLRRDSNSMSVSHSRVAATVRFLAAASERVVSSWRLIVAMFSSRSFCSSGIIGFFLLGLKNEGVVGEQRQRIGDQLVQPRVAESERRLFPARALLLPQNVGDIVGSEGACRGSFLNGAGHGLGSVLPDQFEQFGNLTGQCAVTVGHIAEIGFDESLRT